MLGTVQKSTILLPFLHKTNTFLFDFLTDQLTAQHFTVYMYIHVYETKLFIYTACIILVLLITT